MTALFAAYIGANLLAIAAAIVIVAWDMRR